MAADYDLVVIGGGSAGLLIAKFGPKLGARIAVVEEAKLGGDCTWYGCVPSKALLAAAKVASLTRRSEEFGLPPVGVSGPVNLGHVMDRVRETQQAIYEAQDSPEVLRADGSDVIEGRGVFRSPSELSVNGELVRSRHYCIATGSSAIVPDLPGLDEVPHYTNETIFTELRELPRRLLVLGGGAIGLELGQAFARLGANVTLVEATPRILPGEDAELAGALHLTLANEGVDILTSTRATSFALEGERRCVYLEGGGRAGEQPRQLDAVLIAVGKRPNVQRIGLDEAGVQHDARRGIATDPRMRTSNPRIFAAGDVTGGLQFTHVGAYEAGLVLMNSLTPIRRKADYSLVPTVIFTDPEVASVGLTEEQARARHGRDVAVYRLPFAENDRAITDRETAGFAKIVTAGGKDRIVGAQIIGRSAGELIQEYALAIEQGIPALDVGHAIHAYPTLANGPQLAAAKAFDTKLQSRWLRAFLGGYLRFSRLRDR